jgi:hypothetical protein
MGWVGLAASQRFTIGAQKQITSGHMQPDGHDTHGIIGFPGPRQTRGDDVLAG